MQDILIWLSNNYSLLKNVNNEMISLFSVGAIFGVGVLLMKKVNKLLKKEINNEVESKELFNENLFSNGSTKVNIDEADNNQFHHEDTNKEDKSIFSARFLLLQKLLNETRLYNEKEYTIEYISSLVGIKNVGEMKSYVEGNEEPDEEIKQRFVEVFGVNREWMLFNQGEHPFETNMKKFTNGMLVFDDEPMSILRNERLFEIQEFVIIIGVYECRRSVLIIKKTVGDYYELYPKVYDLDSNVGEAGKRKLVSFYRFLREADKIRKIYPLVYKATEEQFKALYLGDVSPKIARKFEVFKCFTWDFLDLSDAEFERAEKHWDKNLFEVKKIIRERINHADGINQESDLKLIRENLNENLCERGQEKMEKDKKKKVFISYSWVPSENKQWVKLLAGKLEKDGIEVVIDYKDLKLGHDKYAFMERMVGDPSIDKVLIICNSGYKKKADSREGGVGDESTIITPQVYGKVEQQKFIPIVNERDKNGEPYLPIYLASRMYADLTKFPEGYEELLENIMDDAIHTNEFAGVSEEPLYVQEISDKYVKAQELDKKVVFNIEKQRVEVSESDGVQDLTVCLRNITDNIPASVNVMSSETLVNEMEGTVWERNRESKLGVIITQYESLTGDFNVNEKGELQYQFRYKTYNSHFLLICFCVRTKSIYGVETVQFFNISIIDGMVNHVFVETEY